MVAMHNMEHTRYEGKPGRLTGKIEKEALTQGKKVHEQDTQARTRALTNEKGEQVYDSHGRPVEAVYGPLTRKGVGVGRHIDVSGRGRELRRDAAGTRFGNAMLNEEAIQRAQNGDPTHFTVGGHNQWAQNLAYNPTGGSGTSAGTTRVAGPGATGGPAPAGLQGTPYNGGDPNNPRADYPMEFAQRRNDWQGAHQQAQGAARLVTAVGAWGERQGRRQDERAWARDEARGLVRPIIGYRPMGGDVDFSQQRFGPTGHGPGSRPNQPPASPVPPTGFQPPAPQPAQPRPINPAPGSGHPPAPSGPRQTPQGPGAGPLAPPFQPPAPAAPAAPHAPAAPPPASPTPSRPVVLPQFTPAGAQPGTPPAAPAPSSLANPFGAPPAPPAPVAAPGAAPPVQFSQPSQPVAPRSRPAAAPIASPFTQTGGQAPATPAPGGPAPQVNFQGPATPATPAKVPAINQHHPQFGAYVKSLGEGGKRKKGGFKQWLDQNPAT